MKPAGAIIAVALLAGICLFITRANGYQLYVIALVGLTTIVGVGLNVLVGMSGQISLGHAAFYAIGAYVVGILTTALDWTVWAALPLAALVSGVAGIVLALPALRVRGPYLAMVTIAFGFVVEQGAAEWSGLTGGWNGLLGIPMPSVAGFAFSEREMAFFVLACTIASLFLYARLSESPWGKAMRAVRDSEVASQAIGLDPTVIRATAFALSAIAAGLGRRDIRIADELHQPRIFSFPAIDSLSPRRHDRRGRPAARTTRRSTRGRAASRDALFSRGISSVVCWSVAVARAAARTWWSRGPCYAFPRAISPGQTRSAKAGCAELLFACV